MKLNHPVSWIYFFSQRMAIRCLRCFVIATALLWIGYPAQAVLNFGQSFASTLPAGANSRFIVTERLFVQLITSGERSTPAQVKCPAIPFAGEWYKHYERGLCFAKAKLWDEAEVALRNALHAREGDQNRARTYAMHFIEYAPYRELGVALFERGLYKDAIKELKTSLGHFWSEKAEDYLDQARKALNKMESTDR